LAEKALSHAQGSAGTFQSRIEIGDEIKGTIEKVVAPALLRFRTGKGNRYL